MSNKKARKLDTKREVVSKPSVSLIIPAYNEEEIIEKNLCILYDFMKELNEDYIFEILIINDGSTDKTREIIEKFLTGRKEVKVKHHFINLNLGNALKTGFIHASGEYIITLDLDLSYAPHHIREILETLIITKADIVLASPYMKGGKVTAVPFFRRLMSRWANRFMRLVAQSKYHTFTCMVRGYQAKYIKSINLKSTNYEINPEILYKS